MSIGSVLWGCRPINLVPLALQFTKHRCCRSCFFILEQSALPLSSPSATTPPSHVSLHLLCPSPSTPVLPSPSSPSPRLLSCPRERGGRPASAETQTGRHSQIKPLLGGTCTSIHNILSDKSAAEKLICKDDYSVLLLSHSSHELWATHSEARHSVTLHYHSAEYDTITRSKW